MEAAAQGEHHQADEPVQRYLDLLSAAISSRRAHIADADGQPPFEPSAWGWRPVDINEWQPQGRRIGWLDEDNLYIEPNAALAEAQKLAVETGKPLTITPRTLQKRMNERGLLASIEASRSTQTVRRTLEGKRQTVLHLKANTLVSVKTDQTDQMLPSPLGQVAYSGQFAQSYSQVN